MKKANRSYEPHLTVKAVSVLPGSEWAGQDCGWTLARISQGSAYWMEGLHRAELAAGSLLLVSDKTLGRILASQLNAVLIHFFAVVPERLVGLMTGGEQQFLNSRREGSCRIFPPGHRLAGKMEEICSGAGGGGLLAKLEMARLFAEALGGEFPAAGFQPENQNDAKERLRAFLASAPPDVLLEIRFDELARTTNCTARHLSRIFFDLAGMSFREKRAEIRLARARELLSTSQSKVVTVALESGFKSLSLFNAMFTRRFGISPGRWRQKNSPGLVQSTRPRVSLPRVKLK